MAVEVPASVNKDGLKGINLDIPKGFLYLLSNYVGTYDLITEAAVMAKKDYALQAILVSPVVNKAKNASEMLDL